MKLLWAGTFDRNFSRNRKLGRLLQISNTNVETVNVPVWEIDRVAAISAKLFLRLLRLAAAELQVGWTLLRRSAPDVYLVSYPGWFDVPVVWLVSRLKRRPLVFDPFISLHDTVVSDRSLVREGTSRARAMAWIDRLSCRLPDVVIADTPEHAEFYRRWSGSKAHFVTLRLGADDQVFRASAEIEPVRGRIVFHGTFVPLQGVDVILNAMPRLEQEAELLLIGDGQERARMERLSAELGLENCHFAGLVPIDELPYRLATASVCLGIFGSSEKASRVIPNKAYEALAMGRPLVTARTPSTESAFREDELVTVLPNDPDCLARAIDALLEDPIGSEDLGQRGLLGYRERFHESVLSELFLSELTELIRRPTGRYSRQQRMSR